MDQKVDLSGVDPGVGEGSVPRSKRQITVVEASIGSTKLAVPDEVVVQSPLMNPEVLDDPLGFEGPAVRTDGLKVVEDLLVGDSVIRQAGAGAQEGN
jgi:hypothetical protein